MKNLILGDCLDLLVDNRGKNPPFEEEGIPAVSAMHVADGELRLKDARCVSREVYEKWMPATLRRGDVVLTSEAPLGRVAQIRTDDEICLAQRVFGLRGLDEVLDTGFLYYALQSKPVQSDLEGRATGTTVVGIRQSALLKVRIPAPELREQRAIAEVLGALDDKIAANRKLATQADHLSSTYFQRLIRNADANCELSEVLFLEYGKALPATKRVPGNVRVYGSGGASGSHNVALVSGPAVIVGRKGTIGATYWSHGPAFPIDTTFYVVPAREVSSLEYCYHLLRSLDWTEYNSDSAVPGLNRSQALKRKVPAPSPEHVRSFSVEARILLETRHAAESESAMLVALRDALLPRLMSGDLRVRDAESIVSDSV